MHQKQPISISYSSLVFPKSAPVTMDYVQAKDMVDKIITPKIGETEAVVIPLVSGFPAWFYFLVFQKAISNFPEVTAEILPGEFLVLRSIYNDLNYSRPNGVHLFQELVSLPAAGQVTRRPEIKVDLTELPDISFENVQESVEAVREANPFCEQLVFTGSIRQASALFFYALLLPYCQSAFYKSENFSLQII